MNITPHINPLPIATAVNPPTDLLRHENTQRPVITAPTQTSGSPAEKGTADKNKAFNQSSEQFDFVELQKSAEENANQINGNSEQANQENSQEAQQDNNAEASSESDPQSRLEKLETAQNEKIIQELKLRDQEVRAHEQAHAAVGGSLTGAPSYQYQIGPDGKKYAVGGEVSVDLSPVSGDPQATIAKMEKVHAAALAPAEPSAQDIKVAAQASEIIMQARAELSALALEDPEQSNQSNKASPYIDSSNTFKEDSSEQAESNTFDQQINQTLKSQEEIVPTISNDVKERSLRIEGYYSNITQAYEKESSHQFELTA